MTAADMQMKKIRAPKNHIPLFIEGQIIILMNEKIKFVAVLTS